MWGISATVERFEKAMKDAKGRARLAVRDRRLGPGAGSGLLKDTSSSTIPAEDGDFDTVLLTGPSKKVRASSAAWEAVRAGAGRDRGCRSAPGRAGPRHAITRRRSCDARHHLRGVAGAPHDAVAQRLRRTHDLRSGQQVVPYIEPQRVQDATYVRVLLAKDAISTGWDCPRAEVLVSFRPAKDRTHITQLLGRMVRTPLARRIPGDDRLNSVDCLLPSSTGRRLSG